MASLTQDAARFAALQSGYIAQQAQLWSAMMGSQSAPAAVLSAVKPDPGDHRFC